MADGERRPSVPRRTMYRTGTASPRRSSRRRPLEALLLAVALCTLTVLAGPHLLEHLLGVGGDPDHCAACAWSHSARTGAPMVPPALTPALQLGDSLPLLPLLGSPVVAMASQTSRAPPTIA
jgi:hypothetical protein